MGFRFIHTADWQIGKPFAGISGDSGAELRMQRVKTVGRIAELARERDVDAVLVAGDAFDDNAVSDRTIPPRGRGTGAVRRHLGVPARQPRRGARAQRLDPHGGDGPAPNVVVADSPEPVGRWGGRASVLPAPLRRRREALDQTEWFDGAATPDGSCRIGLAHGSVAGRLPDKADAANEIPGDRAARAGLCYLALGDLSPAQVRRRRIRLAKAWPNLSAHRRTVSWLTMTPRAAASPRPCAGRAGSGNRATPPG